MKLRLKTRHVYRRSDLVGIMGTWSRGLLDARTGQKGGNSEGASFQLDSWPRVKRHLRCPYMRTTFGLGLWKDKNVVGRKLVILDALKRIVDHVGHV